MFQSYEKSVIPDGIAKILSKKEKDHDKQETKEMDTVEQEEAVVKKYSAEENEQASASEVADQLSNIAKKVRGNEEDEKPMKMEKDFSAYMNPPEEIQESRIIDTEIVKEDDGKYADKIKRIVIDKCTDKTGKFSEKLEESRKKLSVSSIPVEMVPFDEYIESYALYERFSIGDKKFIMPKEPDDARVKELIDEIIRIISGGDSFREVLLYDVKHDGSVLQNMKYSRVELSIVINAFSDYGAHVRKDKLGELYLDVRGFNNYE